jgi:hypothetical protein
MSNNTLSGLAYELLTHAVQNINITVNLSAKKQITESHAEENVSAPSDDQVAGPSGINTTTDTNSGEIVKADLVRLINDLESVSTTLKKINNNLAGHNNTEMFFMLKNFDKILNSIKMVLNAV